MLEIDIIAALKDNYIYLVRDSKSSAVAVVDPSLAEPVLKRAEQLGWQITHILNTHHHWDHTGGNVAIQKATNCQIVACANDTYRISNVNIAVREGDVFALGDACAKIIEIPGHTLGHIAYYFAADKMLFCGDTLFAMGCGRMFEGTAEQMWHSLLKLRALPDDTKIYCGHEYTLSNGEFCLHADSGNSALRARMQEIRSLRADNKPTLPSYMGIEKQTNIFLRSDQPELQKQIGMPACSAVEVFAHLRHQKDSF